MWLCAVPPLIFLLISAWWAARCPPESVYLGFLQGDQPAYTALAQAPWRGGGLPLRYANPFDADPGAPRVLTNLAYSALGGLMRLAGGRAVIAWEIWRAAWGFACYALFAALVALLFAANRTRWWVFLAGAFGGGTAWIYTAFRIAAFHGGADSWLDHFEKVESGYGFWCLNLFRQSLYPLELSWHALFFAAVLCFLNRRLPLLMAILLILWWSHVITAIFATGVILLATLLNASMSGKNSLEEISNLRIFAWILPLVAVCGFYYAGYLPIFPSVQSWIHQTLEFRFPLRAEYWPKAWGLLLLGAPAALLIPAARKRLALDPGGRLILCWGAAALALAHNDWLWGSFTDSMQPMHFTRGYIHLFFLFLCGWAYECAPHGAPFGWIRTPSRRRFAAVALLLFLMPDNALFAARMALREPAPGLLSISRPACEVLDYLKSRPCPLGISCTDQQLGTLIVAYTPHRVWASEQVLTPDFTARRVEETHFINDGDLRAARRMGIDHLILWKYLTHVQPRWVHDPARATLEFENDDYRIYRLPMEDFDREKHERNEK